MKNKIQSQFPLFHLRLMPLCLGSLVAGILFVALDVWWLCLILFGLSAIGLVLAAIFVPSRKGVAIACLACLALSLLTLARILPATTAPRFDRECEVVGRVCTVKTLGDGQIVGLEIDSLSIDGQAYTDKMSLTVPEGSWVHALDAADYVWGESLEVGDLVSAKGRVRTTAFDYFDSYALHSAVRGLYYRMDAQTLTHLEGNRQTGAEKIRAGLYKVLRRNMHADTAGYAYAFLTGRTCFVEGGTLRQVRYTGLGHLLAVSGLHVGLLSAVVLWILRKLRCPMWVQLLVIAPFLALYAWICGFAPGVVRASLLIVVGLGAACLGRRRDPLSVLSLVGIICLVVQPLNLFDVSFLLSFAAYTGIVLLHKPFRRLFRWAPARLADAISLNLAVSANIYPVSTYFFGGFSFLSILLNLVAIPIMSLAYVVLTIGVLLAIVPPFGFVLVGMDKFFEAYFYCLDVVGKTGYVTTNTAWWVLPIFYSGTAMASQYNLWPKPIKYSIAAAFCAIGFGLCFLP